MLQIAASRYVRANTRSYFDLVTGKKKTPRRFGSFLTRDKPVSVSVFNVFRINTSA